MVQNSMVLFALIFMAVFDQFAMSNASWYYNFYQSISRNSCYPPARPFNGKYTIPYGAQKYGGLTAVGYECNDGYELVGTSYNMCTNKRWSFSTPRCVREDPCKKYNACSNYATCSSLYGSKTCTCNSGYSGDAYSRWGCNKVCKQPYSFSNLNWSPSKTVYNKYDRVTFACSPGYELRGSSSIMCSSYGLWSGNTPYCMLMTTTTEAVTTTLPVTTPLTTTTTTEAPVTTTSINSNSTSVDTTAVDDVTKAVVSTVDTSTDDVSTDGVSTEEVSTEEVSTDDVSTDDASTEEVSTEEVSTDDASTDGVSTEDVSTDDTSTEEVSTDGASGAGVSTEDV